MCVHICTIILLYIIMHVSSPWYHSNLSRIWVITVSAQALMRKDIFMFSGYGVPLGTSS